RVVLRVRRLAQHHQGAVAARRLSRGAAAVGRGDRRPPPTGARRGAPLPAHPPLRLADGAGRGAGRAQGPDRVLPQAPFPSRRRRRERLRDRPVSGERIAIWSDGACSGNPGPGGWGAVLIWNGHEKELKGGEALTTNNRMELMAAIAALEAVKR